MKYRLLIFILFFGLLLKAQDSIQTPGKHSVSFSIGQNSTTGFSSIELGGWSLLRPLAVRKPCISLSFNSILCNYRNNFFGYKLGAGYTQYDYTGEIAIELGYGLPVTFQRVNAGQLYAGLYSHLGRTPGIGWYNELDLFGDIQSFSSFNNSTSVKYTDFTNEKNLSLYLFYQMGMDIRINKHFTLTPLFGFRVLNISKFFYSDDYINNSYRNLRLQLMATYCFIKNK